MSTIKISIVSSSEEIYSGEATMVFATGTLGELGIAPGHTPLLTGLAPGPVRVQNGSNEETFFCSKTNFSTPWAQSLIFDRSTSGGEKPAARAFDTF